MKDKIFCINYKSPIGNLLIKSKQKKIISLEIQDALVEEDSPDDVLVEAKKQLEEFFTGNRRKFELPLHFEGTDFQVKVWKEVCRIPFGETWSYQQVADNIGFFKAVRAVGNSNRVNKIPIIVPCHRVVAFNGKLTGYAAGLWRKEWLIDYEGEKCNKRKYIPV